MRKGNKRIAYQDRKKIEEMERAGKKVTEIGEGRGVQRASIYNKGRGGGKPYIEDVEQRTV